jgi:hypothetical protein
MARDGAHGGRMVCGCRRHGEPGVVVRAAGDMACSHCGLTRLDRALEQAIEALLAERPGRTICPSEAARRVDPEDWRALMEPCREAAGRLCHAGRVRVLKRGEAIDPDAIRGPIRLVAVWRVRAVTVSHGASP